jgi:[ribosomal protein S5]-alanine N-acetyltransferase
VTRARFRRYLAACARPDFAGFLVRRRSDNAILGSLELGYIVRGGFQSVYMGYQIGAPFARQGYMKEAVTLAIRHAFRTLKLHRIEANIQPTNRASIALVKQLGFRKEGYSRRYLKISGRWRDHERWAILREDWTRSALRRPRVRGMRVARQEETPQTEKPTAPAVPIPTKRG